MNPRPSGYEPDELPGCSTPRQYWKTKVSSRSVKFDAPPTRTRRLELALLHFLEEPRALDVRIRVLRGGRERLVELAAVASLAQLRGLRGVLSDQLL